ncbi:MAG: hypothetical protein JWN52_7035 [Actinomycetia bacterium]|nr:hypothetical protein [Actinomycetes bacterium]
MAGACEVTRPYGRAAELDILGQGGDGRRQIAGLDSGTEGRGHGTGSFDAVDGLQTGAGLDTTG